MKDLTILSMKKEEINSILSEIKKAKNWIENSDKYNGNALHILQHLEDFIENKKCEGCKHCDDVEDTIIHCTYFEEYLPKDIGKCNKWEGKNDK
jgi:hypothetical protein